MRYELPWNHQIPRSAKTVLRYLQDCGATKGQAWPSIKTICTKTDYKRRQVQYALRILEQSNLIETLHQYRSNGSQRSNLYILRPPVQENAPLEIQTLGTVVVYLTNEIKRITGAILPPAIASVLAAKFNQDQIRNAIAELSRQVGNGTVIRNVVGWLRVALERGYRSVPARKKSKTPRAISGPMLNDKEREILRQLG